MKRARNEQVRNFVFQYMKRRHFQESEVHAISHKESRKTQTTSLADMSMRKQSVVSTGVDNTVMCSSITGDYNSCDLQFARLRKFVLESPSKQNRELSVLLYPVFVHIYTSLLASGQKTSAHRFHERHNEVFHTEEQKDFIRALRKLDSRTDLQESKEVNQFREHKFSLRLTHTSVTHLLDHLKAADNMVILQIINKHISFQVTDGKCMEFEPTPTPSSSSSSSSSSTTTATTTTTIPTPESQPQDIKKEIKVENGVKVKVEPEVKVKESEPDPLQAQIAVAERERVRRQKETSWRMRNQAATIPPIKFYTFVNSYQGLCTSTVSSDSTLLAGGFEDSSILLWRLQSTTLPTAPTDCSNSHITLAADYIYREENERKVTIDTTSDEGIAFRAHNGPVYKVQFTPDSLYMLSCSRDSTVRLWDLAKRTNTAIYRGHSGAVWDLDFCAATCHFATSSRDQTVKLWTLDRAFPLRCFVGHTHDIESVAIHPNGNYVASGSCDKTVRLWNIQDGKTMRLLTGHRGSVLSLAFSPNGKLLASAGEDRRIHIWDLGSGALLKELRGHTDTVYAMAFSVCNRMLASGGGDSVIRLWDVRHGTDSGSSSLIEGHTSSELQGAFPTKSSTVSFLRFERPHLLQAAGTNQ